MDGCRILIFLLLFLFLTVTSCSIWCHHDGAISGTNFSVFLLVHLSEQDAILWHRVLNLLKFDYISEVLEGNATAGIHHPFRCWQIENIRLVLFHDSISQFMANLADKVSICSRISRGLRHGNSLRFDSFLEFKSNKRNRLHPFGSIPVSGNNWLSSLGEHTDIIKTCRLVSTNLILYGALSG